MDVSKNNDFVFSISRRLNKDNEVPLPPKRKSQADIQQVKNRRRIEAYHEKLELAESLGISVSELY